MKFSNLIFAVFLLFSVSSCKDECKDVNCNFGTCDDGTCICDKGYEGENCDIEMRTKFLGSWTGIGTCDGDVGSEFDLEITKLSTDVQFLVFNFEDGEGIFKVLVSGSTFSFEDQLSDGLLFSGSGNISSNDVLLINLKGVDTVDGEVVLCSLVFNR